MRTGDAAQYKLRNVAQASGRIPVGGVLSSTHSAAVVPLDPTEVAGLREENLPPSGGQDETGELPDAGGPGAIWALLGAVLVGLGAIFVRRSTRRPRASGSS